MIDQIRPIKPQRLFIAVLPDDQVRSALVSLQKHHELNRIGRCVKAENLHITLQFLGNVDIDQIPEITEFIQQLKFGALTLHLNQIGFFPRSRVVWAGSDSECSNLASLAAQVRDNNPFKLKRRESRRFIAHVTLARDARKRITATIDPIYWRIEKCCLMRSITEHQGVRYEMIAESGVLNNTD